MLRFLFAAVAALAAGLPCDGVAQSFPARPVRLVVPYGSGGAPDVLSRTLAQKLGERFDQQFIVDNRPGAGGIIAAENVARSPADGYSLFVADTGHFAINVSLYGHLPYDPLRDFEPVMLVASTPLFLAVGVMQPVKSVADLLALARSRPEGIAYGSSGSGSPHHLAMAEIGALTGANLVHIPYKGVAQSVPAVLTGDVVAVFAGLPSIMPHVKSGKARLIAVNTRERTPLMPDLPTVAETVPGFDVGVSIGILAPAGTPADIVRKLNMELKAVLEAPDMVERLRALGIDVIASTPEQFAAAMRADVDRYARVVKDSGAHVD